MFAVNFCMCRGGEGSCDWSHDYLLWSHDFRADKNVGFFYMNKESQRLKTKKVDLGYFKLYYLAVYRDYIVYIKF